eukprot:gene8758-13998_t
MGFNKDEGTIGVGSPGTPGAELFAKFDKMTELDFRTYLSKVDQ